MKMWKAACAAVIAAACTVSGAAAYIAETPWPMLQHDMFHTGHSIKRGPKADAMEVRFSADINTGISSPVLDFDGTVYVGSQGGCLYAVAPDGTPQCLYSTGGPVDSTPVLSDDGVVYFGSNDGKLHAVQTDGTPVWSLELEGIPTSAPAIGPGGSIFVGTNTESSEGYLYSIGPEGDVYWRYATGQITYSSPAVDQYGNAYIGSDDGSLYALDGQGRRRWTYEFEDPVISSPVITPNSEILVTTATVLSALDLDGNFLWKFSPTGSLFGMEEQSGFAAASPALDEEGNIYIGGVLGDLHCLDAGGSEQWSLTLKEPSLMDPIPATVLSSPIVDASGMLYIRSMNTLYAVTIDGGEPAAEPFAFHEMQLDGSTNLLVEASMALGPGRVLYIPGMDGSLYAVGPDEDVYTLSGTIAGDVQEGIKVLIRGEQEEWDVALKSDGTYSARGLYRGEYHVVPYRQGMRFDPPISVVTVRRSDLTNVDFAARVVGPALLAVDADPAEVNNDGTGTTLITAQVEQLGSAVQSVTLSLIGQSSSGTAMYDDGTNGDQQAGDGTYSYLLTIPKDHPVGPQGLQVNVTDAGGTTASKVVTVIVNSSIVEDFLCGDTNTFEFENPIAGQSLILSYAILEGPAGLVASLWVTGPDGEIFGPFDVSNEGATAEIINARDGIWFYEVTVDCPPALGRRNAEMRAAASSGGQYSIMTTTAGTGVVFGGVTDGETGDPVDVTVSTSIGGTTASQNGYYLLLSPAGAFTVTASHADYAPASKAVSLMSGGSVEANLILTTGVSGNTTCALESLGFSDNALNLLRLFRDAVLMGADGGRELVDRYYTHSPELTRIFQGRPELRADVRRAVRQLIPAAVQLVRGTAPELTLQQRKTALRVLRRLRSCATEPLQKTVDTCIGIVESGELP